MASANGAAGRIESIAVMGAGYVGLPLCLHWAKAGYRVTAVDVDPRVVRDINNRTCKIEEIEDFQRFFQDPDVRANLSAQTAPAEADAFIIAVPTPINEADKSPDLSYVVSAAEAMTPFLRPGNLVVVESTIPPFTTERVVQPIIERSGYAVGQDLMLAHCPERILPGNIMAEAVFNARVVGGVDARSAEVAADLYGSFVKGKLFTTTARTAELVKLIENSYRDVNIAFANQVAIISEELGVDAAEAIHLANQHPRVQILNMGIGVGGHCIPIDPWFLVDACPDVTGLIRAARAVNDEMPRRTGNKILRAVAGIEHPKIVCLGATYKPNVRDTRHSPAFEVVELLKCQGCDVTLYDPLLPAYACDSVLSVARGADVLAILVPHDLIVTEIRYRRIEILAAMRHPNILTFTPDVI